MKIDFIARDPYFEKVAPRPYPAKEHLPNWYKNMPSYNVPPGYSERFLSVIGGVSSTSPKMCTPMYDTFATGYIIPLYTDLEVRIVNDEPTIHWRIKTVPVEKHGEGYNYGEGYNSDTDIGNTGITVPDGYSPIVFKWLNGWDFKTPKGYSCLITDPYANENSPFRAISAIVDTDKISPPILPPFWIKEGFEGIVEKGTPMVQVIPFKRESWKAEYSALSEREHHALEDSTFGSNIRNHYKRFAWTKKDFK
jgi:hypothetical protein